jgi:signal peptidase II
MSLTRKSILIILLILVADQTLKILVKTHMTLYQQIPFFGNWGILHFVENNGMAFGLSLPGELGKILLTSFRIVAVIAIGFYLRRLISIKAHTGLIITLSMVMAGALGNIIDSVFYGLIFNSSSPVEAATLFPEGGGYAPLFARKGGRYVLLPHSQGQLPRLVPRRFQFYFLQACLQHSRFEYLGGRGHHPIQSEALFSSHRSPGTQGRRGRLISYPFLSFRSFG